MQANIHAQTLIGKEELQCWHLVYILEYQGFLPRDMYCLAFLHSDVRGQHAWLHPVVLTSIR